MGHGEGEVRKEPSFRRKVKSQYYWRLIITTRAAAINMAYKAQGNVQDALIMLIHLILTMTLQGKH